MHFLRSVYTLYMQISIWSKLNKTLYIKDFKGSGLFFIKPSTIYTSCFHGNFLQKSSHCFIHWRFHNCREEFELFNVSIQINISLPKTMIMTSQVSITWHFLRAISPESMHVPPVILGLIIWRSSFRV